MKLLPLQIVFFSFLISLFAFPTYAQQSWKAPKCLKLTHCSTGGLNEKCEPIGQDTVHTSNHWGHRAQLDLEKDTLGNNFTFEPGNSVIVTECILDAGIDIDGNGSADMVCTTGNSNLDKQLFCKAGDTSASCDRLSILKSHISYDLDHGGPTGPYGVFHLVSGVYQRISPPSTLLVGTDGKTQVQRIEWQVHTPLDKAVTRSFIVWEPMTVLPTNTPAPGASTEGIGGQQQATLTFPPLDQKPPNDCGTASWDPEGKAFDALSLEPINEAQIIIKQRRPDGVFDTDYALQQNPYMIVPLLKTGITGDYSFNVVNGIYSLEVSKLDYVHAMRSSHSQIPPQVISVYSDLLYFKDSSPIVVNNKVEHRDIPLMPNDGIGKVYPLHILEEKNLPLEGGKEEYTGKLSHPIELVKINIKICSTATGTEVCQPHATFDATNAKVQNEVGKFRIVLDNSDLAIGEYFKREFEQTPLVPAQARIDTRSPIAGILTFLSQIFSVKSVSAQTNENSTFEPKNSASLHPIVRYLEGFAYDAKGEIMSNAKVMLFTSLSSLPWYETTANEKGFYRITSEYIPKMPYTIEYANGQGESIRINTSDFLLQNKLFIETEKITLYKPVTIATNPRRNVTPSFVPEQKISPLVTIVSPTIAMTPSGTEEATTTTTTTSKNPVYLIGAVLLILMGGAGVMLAIYVYKKRSSDDGMSKTDNTK